MTSVSVDRLTRVVPLGRSRWLTILPVAFIMYTIAYFDRANIGLALPYLSRDLNLTPTQAGLAGGVFAWGYAFAQLISGWLTLRFGARNLIGCALLLWGAGAIGTGLVGNFYELLAMRVLLGLFEGPVFAATTQLLAQWFMKSERGRAFGIWNLSSPVGAFLAGPISGLILAQYDWRWMMIIEGLPAWIWAVLWWWRIPASMDRAKWLPAEERSYVQQEIAAEQAQLAPPAGTSSWAFFSEPAFWLTLAGFAMINLLISGFTLWLPSVLKAEGSLSVVAIGVISGLPFVASMIGIFGITRHSDLHGQERRWHSAIPTMITGALMVAAAFVPVPLFWLQIALFITLGFTMKMFLPLIFTRLTEVFPKEQAVPAIAMVSGLGNLFGGFVGPVMIGYLRQVMHDYTLALAVLGAAAVLGGLAFAVRARPVGRVA